MSYRGQTNCMCQCGDLAGSMIIVVTNHNVGEDAEKHEAALDKLCTLLDEDLLHAYAPNIETGLNGGGDGVTRVGLEAVVRMILEPRDIDGGGPSGDGDASERRPLSPVCGSRGNRELDMAYFEKIQYRENRPLPVACNYGSHLSFLWGHPYYGHSNEQGVPDPEVGFWYFQQQQPIYQKMAERFGHMFPYHEVYDHPNIPTDYLNELGVTANEYRNPWPKKIIYIYMLTDEMTCFFQGSDKHDMLDARAFHNPAAVIETGGNIPGFGLPDGWPEWLEDTPGVRESLPYVYPSVDPRFDLGHMMGTPTNRHEYSYYGTFTYPFHVNSDRDDFLEYRYIDVNSAQYSELGSNPKHLREITADDGVSGYWRTISMRVNYLQHNHFIAADFDPTIAGSNTPLHTLQHYLHRADHRLFPNPSWWTEGGDQGGPIIP